MNVGELKRYLSLVKDDEAEVAFKNGREVTGIDVLDCGVAGDAKLIRIEKDGIETVLDKRTKSTLYLVGGLYKKDRAMCVVDSLSAVSKINERFEK